MHNLLLVVVVVGLKLDVLVVSAEVSCRVIRSLVIFQIWSHLVFVLILLFLLELLALHCELVWFDLALSHKQVALGVVAAVYVQVVASVRRVFNAAHS